MMEMLLHMQTTLARHEDEIKESIWLYTAKVAMEQAAAASRKVDQLALDMNIVREKSYEASILSLGGIGVSAVSAVSGTGTGGSSSSSDAAATAAGALKLLKGEMEGIRTVARRIELHQCTDALTFHHLRELRRGGQRTRGRVEELERRMVWMQAEHARELRAVRALAEAALTGGKRGRRGSTAKTAGQEEEEDEADGQYGHYQGQARQRRSLRRRRAEEGYDSDPEQLDAELEEIAVGLDKHSTRWVTVGGPLCFPGRRERLGGRRCCHGDGSGPYVSSYK